MYKKAAKNTDSNIFQSVPTNQIDRSLWAVSFLYLIIKLLSWHPFHCDRLVLGTSDPLVLWPELKWKISWPNHHLHIKCGPPETWFHVVPVSVFQLLIDTLGRNIKIANSLNTFVAQILRELIRRKGRHNNIHFPRVVFTTWIGFQLKLLSKPCLRNWEALNESWLYQYSG